LFPSQLEGDIAVLLSTFDQCLSLSWNSPEGSLFLSEMCMGAKALGLFHPWWRQLNKEEGVSFEAFTAVIWPFTGI